MHKSIRRALIAAPVSAAASLGLVLTIGAGTSWADTNQRYAQGSLSYNSATDNITVKDLKKDGRTFAVSLFGPASDNVYVCKVGGKNKSKTCNYNFNNGRLNVLVFTERGNQHWDIDKFHTDA
ncbi:hypothetical protein [Streptomyces sp. Rer75]|uniref:hypothetical protein n=1 Tax=unclassified Streptomyces TaxID=2593676 RepID=UPI0015D071D5|nr:hypothetical protein [Streptomyces sp. Rer75]QLH23811.1 hypothetical protein HYQ63_26945 [Streptomyces sp. Rer75]